MGRQGIELPQWEMFKRRIWRTPGRWAIIQGLMWIVLTLWFPGAWLDDTLPRLSSYMPDYSDLLLLLVGSLGFAWLYYIIANTMMQLTDTGGYTGWYISPLPSQTALHGVLLTALAQISVTLFGLLAFISAKVLTYHSSTDLMDLLAQMGGDIFTYNSSTALLLLRLPHFILACACFCIAFRHTGLKQLMPLLLTLAAVFAIALPSRDFYFSAIRTSQYYIQPNPTTFFSDNLLALPCFSLILLLLLGWGLVWQARRGAPSLLQAVLLIPLMLAITGGAAGLVKFTNQILSNSNVGLATMCFRPVLQPLHAVLTHIYPNLAIAWRGLEYYRYDVAAYQLLGVQCTHPSQWCWPILSYCLSLVIWYLAALACLNAARYPTLPWRKLLSR